MSASCTLPPLPSGWPYAARNTGDPEARILDASIPGLGSGWTLCLRAPVPLDAAKGEMPEAFGRGGIQRLGEVVLRPYRRGGLVRHVNERRYSSPERFAREFAVHQALWSAGFPTVEPLGYGFRAHLLGVEGVFFTRYVEAKAWPTLWGSSAQVIPELARLLDALVAWGLHAPDLNATNILLTPEGRVLALDWDRARWLTSQDLLPRYHERLLRSLRKLGAPAQVIAAFARSADAQREAVHDNG